MSNRISDKEKIIVRQNRKGLYSAEFDILMPCGEKAGSINMQGNLGSKDGIFQIEYESRVLTLVPVRRREAEEYARSMIKHSPFRPYKIRHNGSDGIMFHDQITLKFLKSVGYHFMLFSGEAYYLYFVGFGEKGICAPIYRGNVLVAEIRKECMVTDDLHIFNILLKESEESLAAIILCCYMYVITYYRAGQKVLKGTQKRVIVTKNEYLLSKCQTII